MTEGAFDRLFGRDEPVARINAAVARAESGTRSVVLVAGEAGIGKTSLVRAATHDVELVGWGTCIDDAGAPGYWPWTRAIDALARRIGVPDAVGVAADDAPLLATIAPVFGPARSQEQGSARDRVLLMDAVSRWLEGISRARTVVVVLDDLQWADESSLTLLEFAGRSPERARLCLIGCYRHDEVAQAARDRFVTLAATAEQIELHGLHREAVERLVASVTGTVTASTVDECYRRAGGHPVFTRELALLATASHKPGGTPLAVRQAISRRVARLPAETRRVLEVAAVAGNEVHATVVGCALGAGVADVEGALEAALDAGMVAVSSEGAIHFAHDLYRETVTAEIPPEDRPKLHRALGNALEERADRSGDANAADLARHFSAAVAIDGPGRAARWALAAAEQDRARLAFAEAAAHLRRWRGAVASSGAPVEDDQLIDVLLAEADALTRAGSIVGARGLLRLARDIAERAAATDRLAHIALATTDLGAQFAVRRDEVVHELETALMGIEGSDAVLEARLTAALARELQHSVASDRPKAGPLSERALDLARAAGDAATFVACLLARHDLLWTPGSAWQRIEVAGEIVTVAEQLGDDERRAEGLLLLANALLETGSAAFAPALESSLQLFDELGQPRHRYVVETRRAALSLLRGALDEAADRIDAAVVLGTRIREPDTQNVRMSQQLELVRATGDAGALTDFAAAAVAHWSGAPVHAHAVAAGFLARAGDLDGARQHVATVFDLGTWRVDRSYLWSVFVRELSIAAIALEDLALCRQLFDELAPLASTCGVNGAIVAFAGSHGHTASLLADALGSSGTELLQQAADTYTRLGATGWLAETLRAPAISEVPSRELHRRGGTWEVIFDGERSTFAHSKGIADIAMLLARPDRDVHALELYGSQNRSGHAGDLVDREALLSYRRRLSGIDEELDESAAHHDIERTGRLQVEREALLAELRRVTRPQGDARSFANYPAERARKAVAARIRDTIRRLRDDAPAFAAHLDGSVVTGVRCRYRNDGGAGWKISDEFPA